MDDARKARRIALGIPVHESEQEHAYDMHSGYCQCGEFNPKWNPMPDLHTRLLAELDDLDMRIGGTGPLIPTIQAVVAVAEKLRAEAVDERQRPNADCCSRSIAVWLDQSAGEIETAIASTLGVEATDG